MGYMLSRFNIVQKDVSLDTNTSIVFNTLSRQLAVIPTIALQDLSILSREELLQLKDINIVVENEQDEIAELKTHINKKRYSAETLMLTIIPTNACNFKCIYCYQPTRYSYMSEEVFNSILTWLGKNLRFYKKLNLVWFGGEPLLHKTLVITMMKKVKELCKKNKVAMVASMTTNGYLLDVNTFQELVKSGLIFYQITIDGNRETHNLQRPHKTNDNSYEVILNNLIKIKELYPMFRFEIGIRINVSGKMKQEDIFQFIDNMKENFSGDKRFVFIWQWVRNWGGDRIEKVEKNSLVKKSVDCIEFMEYAIKKGLKSPAILTSTTGTDACEAFYKSGYVINYDGKVFKCAMCMEDFHNNCIGYINLNGNMQIDTQKELLWLKEDVIEEKCLSCPLLPICLLNRCHYSTKIKSTLKCMEYKSLIDSQINSILSNNKFIIIGDK